MIGEHGRFPSVLALVLAVLLLLGGAALALTSIQRGDWVIFALAASGLILTMYKPWLAVRFYHFAATAVLLISTTLLTVGVAALSEHSGNLRLLLRAVSIPAAVVITVAWFFFACGHLLAIERNALGKGPRPAALASGSMWIGFGIALVLLLLTASDWIDIPSDSIADYVSSYSAILSVWWRVLCMAMEMALECLLFVALPSAIVFRVWPGGRWSNAAVVSIAACVAFMLLTGDLWGASLRWRPHAVSVFLTLTEIASLTGAPLLGFYVAMRHRRRADGQASVNTAR